MRATPTPPSSAAPRTSRGHGSPSTWAKGRSLCPEGYSVRSASGKGKLRHWWLQGSADGAAWKTLKKHANDASLAEKPHSIAFWALDAACVGGDSFRFFRLLQTGPSSSSTAKNCLRCAGIELYGGLDTPETAQRRAGGSSGAHCEIIAADASSGVCYVKHPSRPLAMFCRSTALLPQSHHVAAVVLTRAAKRRLRSRRFRARAGIRLIQILSLCFIKLRVIRRRRVHERAQMLHRGVSIEAARVRNKHAVQAVDEKLSELKSDPQNDAASTVRELDGLIQNAVKAGALAISTDVDADAMAYSSPDSAAKVRAAAAVLVRAKRQGEVKRLLRSQLQLSDGIAEHLAASFCKASSFPVYVPDASALPADARQQVRRGLVNLTRGAWEEAADQLDTARDLLRAAADASLSAAAAAAAASVEVLYALALASDPGSEDKAEAKTVLRDYATKMHGKRCDSLLLVATARLERGGVYSADDPLRPLLSAESLSCLALYEQKPERSSARARRRAVHARRREPAQRRRVRVGARRL